MQGLVNQGNRLTVENSSLFLEFTLCVLASIALGASVIEKHFTLSRADGGVDSAFSMESAEMAMLVEESGWAWSGLGGISYGAAEKEKASLLYRRSIYIVKNISAGEELTPENLRVIRPSYGLAPKYLDILLGKHINKDVKRGTPMSWNLVG